MAKSPASLYIETHYKSLNLQDIWNEKRIKRLCGFLRITEGELSALIGIKEETFFNQLAGRRISMPACILLTLMEDFFIGEYVDDTIPHLMSGALKNGQSRNT